MNRRLEVQSPVLTIANRRNRCFGPDDPSGMLKRLLSAEFSQFIETGSTLSDVN
jgi:hypothetical protein